MTEQALAALPAKLQDLLLEQLIRLEHMQPIVWEQHMEVK